MKFFLNQFPAPAGVELVMLPIGFSGPPVLVRKTKREGRWGVERGIPGEKANITPPEKIHKKNNSEKKNFGYGRFCARTFPRRGIFLPGAFFTVWGEISFSLSDMTIGLNITEGANRREPADETPFGGWREAFSPCYTSLCTTLDT